MFILRKIGKVVFGQATPFQLRLTCLLGCAIGLLPGVAQAPGLYLLLTLLLIILNTNLALAAILGLLSSLLSLALMPVTFETGRLLLDGPLQGFFVAMINAPVLAYFGFEYYATTGGLVVGLLIGLLVGWGLTSLVRGFRTKMAHLESHSERFQSFTRKWWVRALTFLLLGGKPSHVSYHDLLARKVGNPVRPLGIVLVMLVAALVGILQGFASEPIVTMAVQSSLEKANGATVDLKSADLNLRSNRLTLQDLAMADPNDLDRDLLRAETLEADISGMNLLRKRIELDRVVLRNASHGVKRATPGRMIGKRPRPEEEPPREPDVKTIDDYLEDAKAWKERLAQIREWLEKLSGPEDAEEGERPPEKRREGVRERLEKEIKEKGYAHVTAEHLIRGKPFLTIAELLAEKVRVAQLEDETVDITGRNLSTHPHLNEKAPEIRIRSSADTLRFHGLLGGSLPEPGDNSVDFAYQGLPMASVADNLRLEGQRGMRRGHLDIQTAGTWTRDRAQGVILDLPLEITWHNAEIAVSSGKRLQATKLVIPVRLRGPMASPMIEVNSDQLGQALLEAGATTAAARLQEEVGDRVREKIEDEAGDEARKTGREILNRFLKPDEQ